MQRGLTKLSRSVCLALLWIGAAAASVVSASASAADDVPLPPNTLPMYVADPVLPASPTDPVGFGCFKACGPSCTCVNRVDAKVTTTYGTKTCEWHTIQCASHPFCTWHDTCYSRCDYQYPGKVDDGSLHRSLCYRHCDLACVTGADPWPSDSDWSPESLDPGPPPKAYGLVECTKRLLFDQSVDYDGTLTYAELLGCVSSGDEQP